MVIKFRFDIIFGILFAFFVFQDAIAVKIPFFSYFDEVETITVLGMIILYWSRHKKVLLDAWMRKIILLIALLCTVGIIGNLIFRRQDFIYILVDIITFLKFFINILGAKLLFFRKRERTVEDTVWIASSFFTIVLFVLALHDTFFSPFFPYLADRYGMRSLQLFFSNQTYLAATGMLLLIFHYCFGKEKKGNTIFVLCDSLIIISTFRTKALGFVAIALFIIFFISKMKGITKKNIVFVGAFLAVIAGFVGREYLDYYFFSGNEKSLRLIIMRGGMQLASIVPPFGSGFGTYCSLGSKLNYSSAYEIAGIESFYTMDGVYDMFWGTVLGQFGYAGIIIYGLLVVYICLYIVSWKPYNSRCFWSGILVIAYMVISSMGEASFNASYSCVAGLFLGYLALKVNTMKMSSDKEKFKK